MPDGEKNSAPKALPLPRPPERSRRIRRPHVEASRTPTANAVAEARVSRSESLAERGAECLGEQSEVRQRRNPGTTKGSSQGAALAVGVRPRSGDAPTRCSDDGGLDNRSVFTRFPGKIRPL